MRFFKLKFSKNNNLILNMFLSMALTMAIIEFTQVGADFIDGLITTNFLGSTAIAAVGIIHPYFTFMGIFSGMLSAGAQIKSTTLLGEGKPEKTVSVINISLLCATAIAVLTSLICFVFSSQIATLLGARGDNADLLTQSKAYLSGLNFGTIPLMLNPIIAMALALEGKDKTIRISATLCAVLNIILDIASVKSGMGIFGVGLATSAGQAVQFLIMLLGLVLKSETYHITAKGLCFKDICDVFVLGSVKVVKRFSNLLRPVILNNVVIAVAGSVAISALSVNNSILDFILIPIEGVTAAMEIIAALFYGERNKDALKDTGIIAHRCIFAVSIVVSCGMLILKTPIARFYSSDSAELFGLVRFAVCCLALDLPIRALINSRIAYLQATKKSKRTYALMILSRFLLPVAMGTAFVFMFGAYGVLASCVAGDFAALALIFAVCAIKNKSLPHTAEDYLALPNEFNINPGDIIELTISSDEDVSLSAWQVQLFLKGHKAEEKRAMLVAMGLEELLTLILAETKKSGKSSVINLTVTVPNEKEVIIRTRDSCESFNFLKHLSNAEASENLNYTISRDIVNASIKELNYVKSINTNVYVMRIALAKNQ